MSGQGAPAAPGGLVLGRYRVGPMIGRGGMSTVHRGLDTQLGRTVAIKRLAPHLSADPVFGKRLLGEAQAAARVPHPHIVQVLDAGTEPDGSVVLVMELVDGETLHDRLARGRLPVDEAREIAAQVAEALAAAHRRGIVHRDVKPGNVLLARPPRSTVAGGGAGAPQLSVVAKLGDFGIARSMDATGTLTAAGMVMGSAPYIAPEVLEGQPADARADVYALGVTLFQLLAGRLQFEAETASASLAARLAGEAPPVRAFRSDVPSWLDALVAEMIARDPARRPASAAQVATALRGDDLTKPLPVRSRSPHDDTTRLMPARPVSPTPLASAPARDGKRPAVRTRIPRLAYAMAGGLASVVLVAWALSSAGSSGTNAAPEATQGVPVTTAEPSPTTTPAPTATAGPTEVPSPTAVVIRLR